MKHRLTARRVVYAAIAAALVIGVTALFLRPERLSVQTGTVAWRPLEATVDEDGRTRPAESYLVVAPVAGRLQRLTVREGQRVSAGDIVGRVEPLPQDMNTRLVAEADLDATIAQEQSARIALQQAQAQWAQAERELNRRRQLASAGALAAESLEQYTIAFLAAEQALATARETLHAAEARSSAARAHVRASNAPSTLVVQVRAAAPGVVTRLPERSARVVAAGEPLIEIGDTETLEILVDVLTTDAVRIAPGQRAIISNWGGPPTVAVVKQIEPAGFTRVSALGVDEQRVNVILAFQDCPPALGPGYRVDASILVWSTPRALALPGAAMFRRENEWTVFVVRNGRAYMRTIRVGERTQAFVQVVSGLQAGDEVVLFPSDELRHGSYVRTQ